MSQILNCAKTLFSKHLFLTNVSLSVGLSGVGDLVEQSVEQKSSKKIRWNLKRTLSMSTAFGLTSGFLCHYWYIILDRALPGKGIRTVVQKVAWDQIVFSPVCISSCLMVAARLDDVELKTAVSQLIQLGSRLYLAEWVLWPPAQFVNFYFLPTRYRVLYDNVVSLIFDVYTSHVKHQVVVRDGLEDELIRKGKIPSHKYYAKILDLPK